jgi:hypothetical protein
VVSGEFRTFVRTADSGRHVTYRFCPSCGSTIAYELEAQPGVVAVPLGAFTDAADLPTPRYSVYESRKLDWVTVSGDGIEHHD